ncbi:uncharacterized protein LOC141814480 [Curcuma longa]|uniref:uncharacterized protein LOC141814480 n=1 Tax=Curcuma longa TaxID=136217 RepID=UPI003D9FAE23
MTARAQVNETMREGEMPSDVIQSRLKGLPDGWVSEIRYSRLGNSTFKVYIDPKSGYEFRSLKDAHRYILTEDISRCVVKPQKRKSFEPQSEGRELPSQRGDWLPPGWVMNSITQNGGKCHGMKKKSYYNPSTGLRFYSKVKLLQHLNAQKVLTEVSSKTLPNTWRTEITNSQKGAPEYQVPSSIRFEREDCGPSRCHFSDNSPSSLPSQGIVVHNSSCTSSYHNCLVGENSEEIRLANELSPACPVGASSIQATDLEESLLNLETEDLSEFVSSMAYDTGNEPQKTSQQFSELVNDECLFEDPVQMPQLQMTSSELAHSPSLPRQDEDLSALYGNLASEGNFEMSGEVSEPIEHTHELGNTTSMVIEAIKKQYQASKQAAALGCYQMMHSGGEEQSYEAQANALCQLQAETAFILNQPARSNLAPGSFYQQEGAPFVDLVPPSEHDRMQVSTESTAEQEKGDAILDQPAQSNLFMGSFYRQDEEPFVEPAPTCELHRNTQSHQEFSSEKAQLGRSDSEKQKSPHAFAFGNSWSGHYFHFPRYAPADFDDTDKVLQYFQQLEEQTHQ